MKKFLHKIVALIVIALLVMPTYAFAADAITIDSITLDVYEEDGIVDEDFVQVTVSFTAIETAEEITLLLTSENITELNEQTISKVVYIDQRVKSDEGKYVFPIEKSKIASATGLTDIEGCTLYLKMGGLNVSEMASKTFTYNTPEQTATHTPGDVNEDGIIDGFDATVLLRYVAGWDNVPGNEAAMNVNGDDIIDGVDATYLLRYIAGWPNVDLK